ncbi:hypothetical protein DXA39_07865 [Anaerococcus nagyae]|uniref:Uncharacterized protein n=1 Tax=Anaerococcus nagyae TaxID=1755241 RepID=A0A3E2TG03_9FIRM|nr:hypothetical protein DXA39_07865 [Anaerococcus nagyae]
MIKKILFWIYLVFSVLILIISFIKRILEIDILAENHILNKLLVFLSNLSITMKLVIVVVWVVVTIYLYKNYAAYIDKK